MLARREAGLRGHWSTLRRFNVFGGVAAAVLNLYAASVATAELAPWCVALAVSNLIVATINYKWG